MKVVPLNDKIVIKRLEAEEKTAGGIVLPDTAKEKPRQGKVVSVGDGKLLDNTGDALTAPPPRPAPGPRQNRHRAAGTGFASPVPPGFVSMTRSVNRFSLQGVVPMTRSCCTAALAATLAAALGTLAPAQAP